MHPFRRLIAIFASTTFVLIPSLAILASLARAQEPPTVLPGPEGRALFVPNMGLAADLADWVNKQVCQRNEPGGTIHCDPPDVRPIDTFEDRYKRHAGLTVQNAGVRETRALALYFGSAELTRAEGAEPCSVCGLFNALCSPPIPPGRTWTFPLRRTEAFTPTGYPTATFMASVAVYSLGAGAAEAVCDEFTSLVEHPPAAEDANALVCDVYENFAEAFFTREMNRGALRGEPIAAVAAVPLPTVSGRGQFNFDRLALDRYAAVPLEDTGALTPPGHQPYAYHLPGVYTTTPEGLQGIVVAQNAGTECATVRLDAFRTGLNPVNQPVTLTIPVGSWDGIVPAEVWPGVRGSITVRIESSQPVAAAVTNIGYNTSATHTAVRERRGRVTWAVPRAYQPPRPLPLGADIRDFEARPGIPASPLGPDAAEGWETNVAIFNPTNAGHLVRIETQAPGEPARDASYPVEPLSQVVLQLGLGLGLKGGGAGWGRLSSGEAPTVIALESFRVAADAPGATEAWATTAWPYDPARPRPLPSAFALPDLGGPAVGGIEPTRLVTRTAAMTDALVGRIAVQSLYTGTTRVAFDSFAPVRGYVGSLERTIDRFQTITVPLADLPGTRWGANSAIVRVLAGEVAVLVEIARPAQVAVDEVQPDVTSAYLGVPIADFTRDTTPWPTVYLPAVRNGEPQDR